jgi:hypothetical protein
MSKGEGLTEGTFDSIDTIPEIEKALLEMGVTVKATSEEEGYVLAEFPHEEESFDVFFSIEGNSLAIDCRLQDIEDLDLDEDGFLGYMTELLSYNFRVINPFSFALNNEDGGFALYLTDKKPICDLSDEELKEIVGSMNIALAKWADLRQ